MYSTSSLEPATPPADRPESAPRLPDFGAQPANRVNIRINRIIFFIKFKKRGFHQPLIPRHEFADIAASHDKAAKTIIITEKVLLHSAAACWMQGLIA
jgi:hypothetical protein